ncbi:hypothetical protein SAMN05444169_4431 [Bradyrhizobium erythrophlei]|uniref:Uncharacterized protein n=1 Tax=Bradyrhizobium erythrophlei TaxID=1437360 RepID=A0A1M5N6P2_9BRAD|nr:hypothetical protein SAMN05444169_4431 [Bradyrhizobium erythrophlei]
MRLKNADSPMMRMKATGRSVPREGSRTFPQLSSAPSVLKTGWLEIVGLEITKERGVAGSSCCVFANRTTGTLAALAQIPKLTIEGTQLPCPATVWS